MIRYELLSFYFCKKIIKIKEVLVGIDKKNFVCIYIWIISFVWICLVEVGV